VPILASLLRAREGLTVTIRLLRSPDERSRLESLGLEPVDLAELRGVARDASGLVLVSGPPGSGCSTTLSALLAELPTAERRWLVFSRDRRRWPTVPGLVDVVSGPAVRGWRRIAVAHSADGLVLDGGLSGLRARGVLGSATHGRWVLARTDWEDSFALIAWLARLPGGRESLARRLRVAIQQRLVAVPGTRSGSGNEGASGGQAPASAAAGVLAGSGSRAVFEVLVVTDALREAILEGAPVRALRSLAEREGLQSLAERVRAGIAAGTLDPHDAARVLA
jgi:type II secretory ATPase GspE/PulE/Tfp pilus assembly ATPase PilB-like protein